MVIQFSRWHNAELRIQAARLKIVLEVQFLFFLKNLLFI